MELENPLQELVKSMVSVANYKNRPASFVNRPNVSVVQKHLDYLCAREWRNYSIIKQFVSRQKTAVVSVCDRMGTITLRYCIFLELQLLHLPSRPVATILQLAGAISCAVSLVEDQSEALRLLVPI